MFTPNYMNEEEEKDEQIKLPRGRYGLEYLDWDSSGDRIHRGSLWYLIAAITGVSLLIYATVSANFLFALILLMFGLITYLSSVDTSGGVHVVITEEGVVVGSVLHAYKDIEHFWFAYEPPLVKNLYLDLKSPWVPRVVIHLDETNPNEVRELLEMYVVEDLTQDEEPLMEGIARVLKL